MRKTAWIVKLISRNNESNRRVSIPKGRCELDDGPHGTGPYMIYWREGDHTESSELTLSEYVSYVAVRVEPLPGGRGRSRDQLFTRGQGWDKHYL